MKPKRVQQLEPIRAMRVEKLGMINTTIPVKATRPPRRTPCERTIS